MLELPPSAKDIKLKKIYIMEQHIFCFFMDYGGHHRKGVAIYNAT
jgi:hypothetical protein